MNPNFLNRFMKKLTRDRVVPAISARVVHCEGVADRCEPYGSDARLQIE